MKRALSIAHEAAPASVITLKEAGLRFSSDEKPGIQRLEQRGGFVYADHTGQRIKDPAVLARIKALVIPPAWQEVWICAFENGHIQATGRDARGRKQYRYHADWRAARDSSKFHRMTAFATVLPRIRRQVTRDLALRGMPRNKVLATLVRLLEATLIRVGNEEYARQNHSFGLTTLRNRHVSVTSSGVVFTFTGKSGKKHVISLQDRQLARIVKRCQDMPGQELFTYVDDAGVSHNIGSQDVNDYLREIAGTDFTAKDFRTWTGSVLAAVALRELGAAESVTQAKKNIVMAVEAVALKLGNTPAVCRKAYVHPEVLAAYLEGAVMEVQKASARAAAWHLRHDEKALLAFLGGRSSRTSNKRPH